MTRRTIDGQAAGVLAVAEPIKATAAEAINELHALGSEIVMATGDNRRTAATVVKQLGLDAVEAEIDPTGKVAHVKKLRAAGKHVAMAGDGINDAFALSEAKVGIAMGTGTDVATQSARITLMKGDLRGIAKAIRLGHQQRRASAEHEAVTPTTTNFTNHEDEALAASIRFLRDRTTNGSSSQGNVRPLDEWIKEFDRITESRHGGNPRLDDSCESIYSDRGL